VATGKVKSLLHLLRPVEPVTGSENTPGFKVISMVALSGEED